MKTCIAVRHVAFEDLGTFASVLEEAGYRIIYCQAGVEPPDEAAWPEAELAVVLGGPVGVGDAEAYPFLEQEKRLIRARLEAERPLLGVCLGAQLMAAALGARVYPGPRKEIGWGAVSLTPEGAASPLRHLQGIPVLHWHGDTFDPPAGSTLLAATELTPHQAFAMGGYALALQFHPEADASRLETWLIGHCCELAAAGIDPRGIRADAARYGDALRRAAGMLLREWLAGGGRA